MLLDPIFFPSCLDQKGSPTSDPADQVLPSFSSNGSIPWFRYFTPKRLRFLSTDAVTSNPENDRFRDCLGCSGRANSTFFPAKIGLMHLIFLCCPRTRGISRMSQRPTVANSAPGWCVILVF